MSKTVLRFIVDECTGPHAATWLKEKGFEVLSVYDQMPGIRDIEILKIAQKENWIILTNDKDFGEMIFKNELKHHGIILLRLADERSQNKIHVLGELLKNHLNDLPGNFVVVTENNVRIIVR